MTTRRRLSRARRHGEACLVLGPRHARRDRSGVVAATGPSSKRCRTTVLPGGRYLIAPLGDQPVGPPIILLSPGRRGVTAADERIFPRQGGCIPWAERALGDQSAGSGCVSPCNQVRASGGGGGRGAVLSSCSLPSVGGGHGPDGGKEKRRKTEPEQQSCRDRAFSGRRRPRPHYELGRIAEESRPPRGALRVDEGGSRRWGAGATRGGVRNCSSSGWFRFERPIRPSAMWNKTPSRRSALRGADLCLALGESCPCACPLAPNIARMRAGVGPLESISPPRPCSCPCGGSARREGRRPTRRKRIFSFSSSLSPSPLPFLLAPEDEKTPLSGKALRPPHPSLRVTEGPNRPGGAILFFSLAAPSATVARGEPHEGPFFFLFFCFFFFGVFFFFFFPPRSIFFRAGAGGGGRREARGQRKPLEKQARQLRVSPPRSAEEVGDARGPIDEKRGGRRSSLLLGCGRRGGGRGGGVTQQQKNSVNHTERRRKIKSRRRRTAAGGPPRRPTVHEQRSRAAGPNL
jgi:hypothetical protein